jgi:methionyl-tRNA formyltransferase
VQHALLHGDEVTGATTFRIVPELDAGPVFGFVTETVLPTDTAGDLLERLAASGSGLLVDTLDHIEAGDLLAQEQPAHGVTLAPKIEVADARVRWTDPAFAVDRRIRACTPAPGAWTTLGDTRLKLGPVECIGDSRLAPGQLEVGRHEVLVGTGTSAVRLGQVQPPGKKAMAAGDWARGARPAADTRLGSGAT